MKEALRTTLDENLKMVGDTMKYLKRHFDEVFFDAEHFFDGFKRNPAVRDASARGGGGRDGADCLVLCDTNGGCLPDEIAAIVAQVQDDARRTRSASTATTTPTAPSRTRWPAVDAGAVHVQGVDERLRRALRQREPRRRSRRTSC